MHILITDVQLATRLQVLNWLLTCTHMIDQNILGITYIHVVPEFSLLINIAY